MTSTDVTTQAFARLDALKRDIAELSKHAEAFAKIAQALRDPLSWGIGSGILNYARNIAPTELPNMKEIKEKIDHIHQEHFDLKFNVARLLEGSAEENLMKELEFLRGRR